MIYLLILLAIMIAGSIYSKNHPKFFASGFYEDGYGPSICCVVITILLCMAIVFGGITYLNSIGGVAEMEAFYDNTLSVYEYTVDKSESITIYAIKDVEDMSTLLNTGNLAYFELAKSVNANLVELREAIRTYNKRLYSYRKYNAFWFTDSFIWNVPGYLKPIKM